MNKLYVLKGYVYNNKDPRIIKVFNERHLIEEYLIRNRVSLKFSYMCFVVEERLSYE